MIGHVAERKSVNQPERNAQDIDRDHAEREVVGGLGAPSLRDLRDEGDGGAEASEQSKNRERGHGGRSLSLRRKPIMPDATAA